MSHAHKRSKEYLFGFTLIEMLIATGVVVALTSITIIAINPEQQFINAQDSYRLASASELLKAIEEYAIDHGAAPNNASIPDISDGDAAICRQGVVDPACINMDALVPNYIIAIPADNYKPCDQDSGYGIVKIGSTLQVDALNLGSTDGYTDCNYNSLPISLLSGLVGYWKLDDSPVTAADASGNNNIGTYNGTVAPSTDTPTFLFSDANSMNFNGSNSYIDLGSTLDAGMTTFTMSVWVKPSTINGTQALLSQWTSKANGQIVLLQMNNGVLSGFVRVSKASKLAGGSFNVSVPAGVWSNIIFNYNGTRLLLYLNGQLSPVSFAINGTLKSTSASLSIGGENRTSADGYYAGLIDDVRLYNRTLTYNEITSLVAGN